MGINGKSYPTMDELLDLADELKNLKSQLQGLIREAKLGMNILDIILFLVSCVVL